MKNKNIAVWFSCGAASAVAAKLAVEKYGDDNSVMIVNNPVDEEHEDNRRFLKDVEDWIGRKIIIAKNTKVSTTSAKEVWARRKYMSGVTGAPCTIELKKEARYQFEKTHKIDYHILGFTVDEWKRAKRFKEYESDNLIPILVSELLTKEDCFEILHKAGIKLPEVYSLGFPNANCIGCVKSSSPTYWNLVRKYFPDVFEDRAKQSRKIGAKLVIRKGKRIFLDELLPSDKGGKIKNWNCSTFCENNKHNF